MRLHLLPRRFDLTLAALLLLSSCSSKQPTQAAKPPAVRIHHGASRGCGKPHRGTGRYEPLSVVANEPRSAYLYTPESYDASRPYALVFRFHGHGGSGVSGGLEIERASRDDALVISPDGLTVLNGKHTWWHVFDAADLALFDTLLAMLSDAYCIDLDRVFVYGFSAGGGMAQELACKRADVVRAVGSISAIDRVSGLDCSSTTAGYMRYDQNDPAVPLATGITVRDHLLAQNGCGQVSVREDEECVRYTACAAGEPVVFCTTSRAPDHAHDPGGPDVARRVWEFFASLPRE